jgi:anthranilate phosphoribosyltransferase
MVVHGLDGMDEISVSSVSKIVEINEQGVENEFIFDPRTIGGQIYRLEELRGENAQKNAEIAHDILNGTGHDAIKEAVLLNTGAALYVAGISESIKDGYVKAKNAFEDGSVKAKVEQIIKESQSPG